MTNFDHIKIHRFPRKNDIAQLFCYLESQNKNQVLKPRAPNIDAVTCSLPDGAHAQEVVEDIREVRTGSAAADGPTDVLRQVGGRHGREGEQGREG